MPNKSTTNCTALASALQQIGKRISYFPVSTLRVLSGMNKLDLKTTSRQALVEALGSEQKLGVCALKQLAVSCWER